MKSITFMSELNNGTGAEVDSCMVPLIKFINKLGMKTVASGGGSDKEEAYVSFVHKDGGYAGLTEFLFKHIRPMIDHLGNKVQLQITYFPHEHECGCPGGYTGWLVMVPEVVEEVTKRMGCWVELMHK